MHDKEIIAIHKDIMKEKHVLGWNETLSLCPMPRKVERSHTLSRLQT